MRLFKIPSALTYKMFFFIFYAVKIVFDPWRYLMKKIVSVMIVFFIFLGICSNVWAGGGKEKQNEWDGIYMGVIPAADCPGIAVVAILSTDGKYKITYQYIDRSAEVLTYTGTFTHDEKTKKITLDSNVLPRYYELKKQDLIQLDLEGNAIKGNLSDLYKLRKVNFPKS